MKFNFNLTFFLLGTSLCQFLDEGQQERNLISLADPFIDNLVKDLIYIRTKINIPISEKSIKPKYHVAANDLNPEYRTLKRYARFAGSAYCIKPTLITWTCSHCIALGDGIKVIDIFEDLTTAARGYAAIDNRAKQILLVFRGSSSVRSFFFDFVFIPSPYTMEDGTKTYIHKGFHIASNNLKPKYLPIMKSLISQYPDYEIIFTGHSLGASMATMALVEIHRETRVDWSRLHLFTYGEPVIGHPKFVTWLSNHSKNMIRVVNDNDIVPNINRPDVLFVNHNNETWLNQFKMYKCSTGPRIYQDKACLPRFGTSIIDHLTYFDFYTGIGC